MKRKRGPKLFEVMSKAPQVQYPSSRRGWLGLTRGEGGAEQVPVVAERLTEAEAAAELTARREAEEERRREKEARKTARIAAKAEKTARRQAQAEAKIAFGHSSPVAMEGGRLTFSLNTVGMIAAAAAVCVVMLGSYAVGRKSMQAAGNGNIQTAAALTKPAISGSPLLPSAVSTGDQKAQAPPAQTPQLNPDLTRLLQKPPSRGGPEVGANAPAQVKPSQESDAATKDLICLQIESLLITRQRSGDLVANDVVHLREFLAKRGVKTIARRYSNGFVLYSEQGFPSDAARATDREAFRKRIEALGKEYRKAGGLYEFKGCDFVSYAKTQMGRAVE